ncbi:MAG TPA: PfkB family carbohydrate kinase [Solirubrobacteraceae bacterium]|jgi:ribokinase|nr:PfkB family carbohydrate kinase [Solirubrobacteraceae bacterium]
MSLPVRLVVVGPITWDVSLALAELPADADSAVAWSSRFAAGGKGVNPAVCAARLGAEVRLVGSVGDDHVAEMVLAQLSADGIDTRGVCRKPGLATGVIVHLVQPGGRRRYIESRGANAHTRIDAQAITAMCDPETVMLISTALPVAAVTAAVSGARVAGARIVADLAGTREASMAALDSANIVRGDAEEISHLTGCAITNFSSAAAAAERLLEHGPEMAVVQAAGDGDLLMDANGELRLPRLPVQVIDPTGGGDALIATLSVLLASGTGLHQAGRLASAASAHTVTHLGGRPDFDNIDELQNLLAQNG